jgi:hypothetical protein
MGMTIISQNCRDDATQLNRIRNLMLAATARGAWLTLGEIADITEFGEASISAQLRHLRKARHGRYSVEKRVRRPDHAVAGRTDGIWEYRVLAPQWGGHDAEARD